MKTNTGTVNGVQSVINLEERTFIEITGERRLAQYMGSGPWPYTLDPNDKMQWHNIQATDVVAMERDESKPVRWSPDQTNFERVLWEAVR